MTDQPKPRRYTFDRGGRVIPPGRRPGTARKYVTDTADQILKLCYPGEVPAAVVERALKRMAKADGKRLPGRPA